MAALLWLGGAAYRRTTAYRNLERTEETEKYREMPERIAFAVFGPSHGRDAFQKEDYGEGFFNFSMSSQTPQYDWMQLREFQDCLAPGATVVLERWSPLLTTECGEILSAFLQPQELREDTNTLYGRQELTQEMLESERARMQKDHVSLIEPAMPDGNPVMLDAFREILALCQERGWNAVLVTPPYPAVYTECFPSEVMDRFCAIMEALSGENGVPWLNYAQDREFTENFAYFKNIDHLNLAGSHAFAAKLQPRLTELGLWQ